MSNDCVLEMDPPDEVAIGKAGPALYVGRSVDNALRSPKSWKVVLLVHCTCSQVKYTKTPVMPVRLPRGGQYLSARPRGS